MVKTEVKTSNKRKNFGSETPAKKQKFQNGNKTPNKPFAPQEKNQSPKNQQNNKKFNKKNKARSESDSDSPKKMKPFAGTGQIEKPKQKKEGNKQQTEKQDKKKRRSLFSGLKGEVKLKTGSKDNELIKKLEEKIKDITARPELTKTAKRKLAILHKLKDGVEGKQAAEEKATPQVAQVKKNKQTVKKESQAKAVAAKKNEGESEEESGDEVEGEESGDSESGEEDSDAEAGEGEAEENSDEADDGEEQDEEDDESDEESDEEPAPQGKSVPKKPNQKKETEKSQSERKPNNKALDLSDLKQNDLMKKGQKRFVLFVGNIPYDTSKQDLVTHFSKAGNIMHVRIPTEKGSNRPRGFGYVEVEDETTYQKCLSMHHSQLKGRRLNVLYTQGGKKKGEEKKKEIKIKNMKLHALRNQGKLAGSVKQSQKRSFRRNKSKQVEQGETDD